MNTHHESVAFVGDWSVGMISGNDTGVEIISDEVVAQDAVDTVTMFDVIAR